MLPSFLLKPVIRRMQILLDRSFVITSIIPSCVIWYMGILAQRHVEAHPESPMRSKQRCPAEYPTLTSLGWSHYMRKES